MNRGSFLILLGVLVILSPFAGLPSSLLAYLLPLLGALIVLLTLSLRVRRIRPVRENA